MNDFELTVPDLYKSAEINLFCALQGQRLSLGLGTAKQSVRKLLHRPPNIPFKHKNASFFFKIIITQGGKATP